MRYFVPLVWVVLAMGCAPSSTEDVVLLDLGSLSLESVRTGESGMLPAYRTEAEGTLKADLFGRDPRERYPEYYGFTDPPEGEVVLPGEFEDVQELLIGWAEGAWSMGRFFLDLVDAASRRVPVTIVVSTESEADSLREAFSERQFSMRAIRFAVSPLDSIWMRDYGPLGVQRSGRTVGYVDSRYHYGRWYDDALPTLLAQSRNLPVSRIPLQMEGGNLLSDGEGRCITTDFLIQQNKALGHDADDVRRLLRDYLGCDETTFLLPLAGEGTGHVDMFVSITGPGEAIVGYYEPRDDSRNARRLDDAARRLEVGGFTVRRVPMPSNSRRSVFRSYTNGLAVDGALLIPVYEDDRRYEDEAIAVFSAAYPGREIVPIESEAVIRWAGAVHCVTMTIAE